MSKTAHSHSQPDDDGAKIGPEYTETDNGCFANLSDLEILGLPKTATQRAECPSCGRRFRPDFNGQKYCDGPCYHDSLRIDLKDRFWSKVDRKGSGCWLWIAKAVISQSGKFPGYGQISGTVNGKKRPLYSHRVAWELTYGPIPDGLFVLHKCDVSLCCNPDHLFLGTQQDNLQDARRKGRLDESRPRRRRSHIAQSRSFAADSGIPNS